MIDLGDVNEESVMAKSVEEKKNKRQEVLNEACQILRTQLQISTVSDKIFCYIAAIHKNAAKNRPIQIPCRDCHAFGSYVYDAKNDCVLMQCAAFQEVGPVNCCVQITLEGTGSWRSFCPLPPQALNLLFSAPQSREVKDFVAKYPSEEYQIHFIQMIGCS